MQVDFVSGHDRLAGNFVAGNGIGPSDGFPPDFVVGFPGHLFLKPCPLFGGGAVLKLLEVADAPRPKRRLNRGFGGGVAGKG